MKLSEWISCLGPIAAAEAENAAVEIIAPRFSLGRHYAGYRFAEFSVVILGSDLCLGDRIEIGIDNDNAQNWVLVIGSIQLVCSTAEMLAVDENLLAALWILGLCVCPTHELLGARRQQHEFGEVAVINRQVLNSPLIKDGCDVSAIRLQLRSFRRDFHRLRRATNLKLAIDPNGGISRNNYVLVLERFEPSAFRLQVVCIGN